MIRHDITFGFVLFRKADQGFKIYDHVKCVQKKLGKCNVVGKYVLFIVNGIFMQVSERYIYLSQMFKQLTITFDIFFKNM